MIVQATVRTTPFNSNRPNYPPPNTPIEENDHR